MKKLICLFLSVLITFTIYAQEETFFAEVDSNYVTLWHTNAYRDCDAAHDMVIHVNGYQIDWFENYKDGAADCYCYFDLSISFGPLNDGYYKVDVYINESDTIVLGSIEFEIETNQSSDFIVISDEYQSPCGMVSVLEMERVENLKYYPNPFTKSTTIEYTLNSPQSVTITFYNQFGKVVDWIEQKHAKGKQQVTWNAEGLSAGIYYFRLEAGEQVASGKVVLVK